MALLLLLVVVLLTLGNGTLALTHATTVPPRLAAGGRREQQAGSLSHRTAATLRERQSAPTAGDVHVTAFGADPTGKTDASAPIQAALQHAITSPGIVTVHLDGGTYLLDSPVVAQPPHVVSLSLSLSLALSRSLSRALSVSLSLCLSLTHTHAHTHTRRN